MKENMKVQMFPTVRESAGSLEQNFSHICSLLEKLRDDVMFSCREARVKNCSKKGTKKAQKRHKKATKKPQKGIKMATNMDKKSKSAGCK